MLNYSLIIFLHIGNNKTCNVSLSFEVNGLKG